MKGQRESGGSGTTTGWAPSALRTARSPSQERSGSQGTDAQGRLEGVPGRWRVTAGGIEVRADVLDRLSLDGEALVGAVKLTPAPLAQVPTTVTYQDRRLELLDGEGSGRRPCTTLTRRPDSAGG